MDLQKNVLYNFDGYSVNVAERQTRKGDRVIPLTPKAFETLVVLLENRGRVLEKDFLLDRIWADTFVGEATLAQNISTLRKTFGPSKNGQQFIETVSGRGYRFIADVRETNSDEEVILFERRMSAKVTSEYEEISDDTIVTGDLRPVISTNTSFKEKALTWIRSNKRIGLATAITLCLLLATAIMIRSFSNGTASFAGSMFREVKLTMLTSDGVSNRVAISPDGKYIAIVKAKNELRSIQVRQLDNSATVEILPPQDRFFRGLTFSPDGKQIYYVTYESIKSTYSLMGTLYKIPMLGGTPQRIVTDVDSPIAISPDGSQFAFIRDYPNEKESALMIDSFDEGAEPRKLAVRDRASGFLYSGLSWSPDGKIIVCGAYPDEKTRAVQELAIQVKNGEQSVLTETRWQSLGQPTWLADGSGVIISGIGQQSVNHSEDLWIVSYPQQTVRQIPTGITSGFGLSVTSDSKTIVIVKTNRLVNYWVTGIQNIGTPVRVTQNLTEASSAPTGISWTPDGKILFGSTLNGNLDIWRMNADGTDKRQITTNDGADSAPIATSDGRFVVFVSDRSGTSNLWRMKPDGTEPTQLTNENFVSSPSVTSDSQTVYYTSRYKQTSRPFLHRISIDGGESVQINSKPTMAPKVSPDGKLIACYFPMVVPDDSANGDLKLTILDSQTGEVVKQYGQLFGLSNMGSISWSGNRTFIYSTLENDVSKMWEQSTEKERPKLLSETSADDLFGFAYWVEGNKLALEKIVAINDVVAISSADPVEKTK